MKKLVDKPKPAFPLYRKKEDGTFDLTLTKAGDEIWVCGECGILHTRWIMGKEGEQDQQRRANECCLQTYCACGEKILSGYTGPKCSGCNAVDRTARLLEKAVEIEYLKDVDCPVYSEDNEEYWSDIGAFEDWARDRLEDGIEEDEVGIPEWIFPCTVKPFGRLDASDVIYSNLEDMYEDAVDHIIDLDGLQKYLDEWCDKQTVKSWEADFSRKISTRFLQPTPPAQEPA